MSSWSRRDSDHKGRVERKVADCDQEATNDRSRKEKKNDRGSTRNYNLLIRSQTRYHYATRPQRGCVQAVEDPSVMLRVMGHFKTAISPYFVPLVLSNASENGLKRVCLFGLDTTHDSSSLQTRSLSCRSPRKLCYLEFSYH